MKTTIFNKPFSFEKEITRFAEKLCQLAKSKGRATGRKNPPKEKSNVFQLPFSIYIISGCWELFNKLFGFVETTIQNEYTRYQQIIKEYLDNDVLNNLLKEKKRLRKAMKKALKEVSKFIKKQVQDAEKEIKDLQDKIKNWEQELDDLNYTKVFWPILISLILIVGILASEAFVNQKAFLFMKGENFMTSLTIAVGISFCTFLLGMGVSRIIQNTTMEVMQKVIYAGIIVLVALGAYYGIAVLRVSMMENLSDGSGRDAFVMSKSTLLMINFGFFVSLVLVKIYLFPQPKVFKMNSEFKALKKRIKQALAKIAKLQNEITTAHNRERAEKDKVRQEFAKQEIEINDKLNTKKEALKKHQVEYNRAVSVGLNLRDQLTALALKAIGIYIEEMNAFRNDEVVLEMPEKTVAFKNNPLDDYPYINDDEVENLFDTDFDTHTIHSENNTNNNIKNDENDTENNNTADYELDL